MKRELTIQELLQRGVNILENKGNVNPLLDTQLLLCYTLKVDKVYIYTHRNEKVSIINVDKFLNLLNRRETGYPLQYILGKQEFMGLDFEVAEGVLVPRPDTETIVEWIVEVVNTSNLVEKDQINILDIGTGSGAIALSLAYFIKNSIVYTIDISDKALDIAKRNANTLNLEEKVKFLKGDLFEPLKDLDENIRFDIIVSNPPYIPSKEIDDLQIEVASYEPRLALDGGEDGLDFYKRIVDKSTQYLRKGGILALEIGYNQGKQVKKLLIDQQGFKDIEIRSDLAGLERAILSRRQGTSDENGSKLGG